MQYNRAFCNVHVAKRLILALLQEMEAGHTVAARFPVCAQSEWSVKCPRGPRSAREIRKTSAESCV